MEIQLQLILFACAVYWGLTFVQPHNQLIDQTVNDESEVQENFQRLFNTIAKNEEKKSKTYHKILAQELKKDFDTMREELWFAQMNRNAQKMRNFYRNADKNSVAIKRETNENNRSAATTRPPNPHIEQFNDASSSEEKRFLTPITPITTINNTKVMNLLTDLWVSQEKLYKDIVRRTEELCNKTSARIKPIRWLFNEIDPLFYRQIKVLTTKPWQDTDEMYQTLDYELLDQQERSWNALGRCLTDNFHFPEENKPEEQELRNHIEKARIELVKRKKTIVGLTNINFTMWESPYSIED